MHTQHIIVVQKLPVMVHGAKRTNMDFGLHFYNQRNQPVSMGWLLPSNNIMDTKILKQAILAANYNIPCSGSQVEHDTLGNTRQSQTQSVNDPSSQEAWASLEEMNKQDVTYDYNARFP